MRKRKTFVSSLGSTNAGSQMYRDIDGSVNIIFNFGWAGSPDRLILFLTELKAPDMGISVRDTHL